MQADPWDEAAVIAFYTERYGWSEQQVRANVLTRHSPDVLAVPKPFDRASVMMFPIPNDQTVGDYEIEGNSPRLSPLDRQSIAQLYPRPAPSAATAAPTDEPPPSPGESGAGNVRERLGPKQRPRRLAHAPGTSPTFSLFTSFVFLFTSPPSPPTPPPAPPRRRPGCARPTCASPSASRPASRAT